MTRIETILSRCGLYLEVTCFHKHPCTDEMILNALALKNFVGTVHEGPAPTEHSIDESHITFECEGWTIYICEEMFAESPTGDIVFSPGF